MIDHRAPVDFDKIFDDGAQLDEAVSMSTFKAVARHKALNEPVVVWRDGKPTWLDSKEIDLESIAPPSINRLD